MTSGSSDNTSHERGLRRWARPALAIYWPVLTTATHWPRLDLANPPIGPVNLDKLLHVAAFGLLTALLILAKFASGLSRRGGYIASATVVAAVYAVVDEYTQGYVGRTMTLADLAANGVGIGAVALIFKLGQPRTKPMK